MTSEVTKLFITKDIESNTAVGTVTHLSRETMMKAI